MTPAIRLARERTRSLSKTDGAFLFSLATFPQWRGVAGRSARRGLCGPRQTLEMGVYRGRPKSINDFTAECYYINDSVHCRDWRSYLVKPKGSCS